MLGAKIFAYILIFVLSLGLQANTEKTLDENAVFERIEFLLDSQKYREALDELNKTKKEQIVRTWKFHKLKGDALTGLKKKFAAAKSYNESLKINPKQTKTHLNLSQFYYNIRKPAKSFHHIRLYLALESNDIAARYRGLILSSRLGNLKYFKYTLERIQTATKEQKLKHDETLKLVKTNFEKGDYLQVQKDCEKYLPFFPQERKLHDYLYLAHRKLESNTEVIENVLIDSVAIFRKDLHYQLKLALFFKSQKRLYRALSLLRRSFQLGLIQEGFGVDEEILYHIKQVYYELGYHTDAKAIASLIQTIQKREEQNLNELDSFIRLYNFNREYLVFTLHYLAVREDEKLFYTYSKMLLKRDEERRDKEFMNIFSPFQREELRIW